MIVGQTGSRIGKATSTSFKVLFAVAVIIATATTFISITDTSPSAAGQPGLFWLLIGNFLLICGLGSVFASRIFQLIRENQETGGGARLRLRIILLFSLAAAVPTVIVAGILGVMINRNVQVWFSDPVYNLVDNARAAAQASQNDVFTDMDADSALAAEDLSQPNYVRAIEEAPDQAAVVLEQQAVIREFARARIMTSSGEVITEVAANNAPPYREMSPENWAAAREGRGAISIEPEDVVALRRLGTFDDAYLYVSRPFPAELSARLAQANEDLRRFREAEARRERLGAVLTLSFVETALLMLLGTAWLGMTAASRIAAPIGELASAARSVRDGNLHVRIRRPVAKDEIDDLADAFNQMTERISRQTKALDDSRIEAETRSAFTETVLAAVEAGVIRVEPEGMVTIANASAIQLLGLDPEQTVGQSIDALAPEFQHLVRRSLDTGLTSEGSIQRPGRGGIMHFHVRVAPEVSSEGAVITFHDTTRLIQGQRQAAWRDVARRIAHEIRNPLTPIQLSAERLRRRFSNQITQDRETFERCTDTITRQVADIGRMVEEFSGFARMPKPTFERFNIGDVVTSVTFARRMANPSITVNVKTPPEPIEMMGDERLLAQALTNVVKNAAEAVERHGGSGQKHAGSVTVEVQRTHDEVEVVVRDTGVGFPQKDRDRLLEPYVTTREQGVGLGLAIVARIVADHGGTITLGDNEKSEHGARVVIRLPVAPNELDPPFEFADQGAN